MSLLEKYFKKIAFKSESRNRWKYVFVPLGIFISISLFIIFPYSLANQYSSLLNFFSSFFLLLITSVYVYYTKTMVTEMIKSRKLEKTPNIKVRLTSYSITPKSSNEKHDPSGHNQFYCKFKVTNRSVNSVYDLDLDIIYPTENNEKLTKEAGLCRISKDSGVFSIPDELHEKSEIEIEVESLRLFLRKTDYKTDSGQIEVTLRFEDEFRNLYLLKQFYGIRYYSGSESFGFRILMDELRVLPFNKRKYLKVEPWGYLEDIIFYKNDIIYSYTYTGYGIEY